MLGQRGQQARAQEGWGRGYLSRAEAPSTRGTGGWSGHRDVTGMRSGEMGQVKARPLQLALLCDSEGAFVRHSLTNDKTEANSKY